MNDKLSLQKIVDSIIPFILAGIAIALFLGLLFVFSYVIIWGLIIGGILWLIATVKQYLFASSVDKADPLKKQGRIIEHNDKK